eukprot:3887463-Ditylum_brightwellii.AAC.1
MMRRMKKIVMLGKSISLIWLLGTFLSLDKMRMQFAGRSLETHHMKNKPISEGCKFICLATKEGYIINFTPDGRTVEKLQQQEYKEDKKLGNI